MLMNLEFAVLEVVTKVSFQKHMMPYTLTEFFRRFRKTFCPHFQDVSVLR
jgi:hypothetical protein